MVAAARAASAARAVAPVSPEPELAFDVVIVVVVALILVGRHHFTDVTGRKLDGADFRVRGILPSRRAPQQRVEAIVRENHHRSLADRRRPMAIQPELIQKPGQMISDRACRSRGPVRASSHER